MTLGVLLGDGKGGGRPEPWGRREGWFSGGRRRGRSSLHLASMSHWHCNATTINRNHHDFLEENDGQRLESALKPRKDILLESSKGHAGFLHKDTRFKVENYATNNAMLKNATSVEKDQYDSDMCMCGL